MLGSFFQFENSSGGVINISAVGGGLGKEVPITLIHPFQTNMDLNL